MRQFAHPNKSNGWRCPICGTNHDSPVILMPIPGTEEGHIVRARQVHTECFVVMAGMSMKELGIEPLEEE
jgi:hypothetical protein